MNKEIIAQTAESMKGQPFLYGNQHHYIKNYSFNDETEKFMLVTDKKTFTRPYESAMEFLDHFEPVPERMVSTNNNPKGYYLPERSVNEVVVSELKDVLLDNIKKIKENKDYIPQAEAIKANVDSVISLAKTEIEYLHALDRLNR